MTTIWLRAAIQILILASPVGSLAADPPVIVNLDYDRSVNFSKFRSYIWVAQRRDTASRADYDRVRAAVDRALGSRFRLAKSGDFAIAISGVIGPTGEYQGSYGGGGLSSVLSIDIYDTSTKRPIWHGIVRATPGDLKQSVGRLLAYFPPSNGCTAASSNPADQLFSARVSC